MKKKIFFFFQYRRLAVFSVGVGGGEEGFLEKINFFIFFALHAKNFFYDF